MYSNKIVNFQGSTTILNACIKKSVNVLNAPSKSFLKEEFLHVLFLNTAPRLVVLPSVLIWEPLG